jgi:two-component system LytT family response regulator
MSIRALVVDDQPMAVDRLVTLLTAEPDVEVVGTAMSGAEAVSKVNALAPDLVFLDMQMPELDGFGVVEAVGANHMPLTVFVTAHDEYALRAFEVHALDYLLKPFARARFQEAVARARRQLQYSRAESLAARLAALVDDLRTPEREGPRLLVRSGGRVIYVPIAQIDWIEAQGNYSHLQVSGTDYLVRATMTHLLEQLAGHRFARIHRSRIVNLGRVRELRSAAGGEYEVVLHDGRELGLSRMYRSSVQERLAEGPAGR